MQHELPMLGNVKRDIKPVDEVFLRHIKTRHEAINLCINLSGLKDYVIAEQLGIDKGNFSKMRKGSANFPPDAEHDLYELCGNRAPFDWDCYIFRLKAVPMDKDEQIRALEEQLEALRVA